MEKQKKVLDASVIVKGFAREENSDKAIEIIKSHITNKTLIIVPELLFLEVINSFRFKNKNIYALKKINDDLIKFQFKTEKLNKDLMDKTIEISVKNNLTIYDALYVAIAQLHGCPLITADKGLYGIPNAIPLEKT